MISWRLISRAVREPSLLLRLLSEAFPGELIKVASSFPEEFVDVVGSFPEEFVGRLPWS